MEKALMPNDHRPWNSPVLLCIKDTNELAHDAQGIRHAPRPFGSPSQGYSKEMQGKHQHGHADLPVRAPCPALYEQEVGGKARTQFLIKSGGICPVPVCREGLRGLLRHLP